jgi:hypothetical protein
MNDIIVISNLKNITVTEFVILEQICLNEIYKHKHKIFKKYHNFILGKN